MSSTTNTATNGRSLNGVISISDGVATLENGNLACNDINSSTINTTTLSTDNLTCKGTFLSNTNGSYTIPTATTSITGSLISYNNSSGNGETDFTNYGSTYNILLQGFRFWNVNSTQTLNNLAIINNTQTYFKSQLVGCTAETPLNTTSIVNKSYCDNNFIDFNTDQTISGTKRFNNFFCTALNITPTLGGTGNKQQVYVSGTSLEIVALFNNNFYRFYTKDGASTQTNPLSISSASTTITNSLVSNNLTADVVSGTQNIYTTNTTGIINIGTGFTTGTLNIGTATSTTNVKSSINISKGMLLYDVSSPFSNFCQLYPTGANMNYIMNAGATTATTHNFYAYNNTNLQKNALTISYSSVSVLDGLILSCRQIRSTATSNGFHELFSNMIAGGVLTMGSLTSNIINNSINTLNAQHTFNNSAPISNTSPTLPAHLTTKSFTDSTYATITSLGSYLTTSTAAATYATITSLGSYLTTSTAAATYATITSLGSYLTSSAAALLYQEKIVGSIILMAMGVVPTGYLSCNGASYSISTYPALSAFLNFTYGGSSASGLFQLPDFRGMFLRGSGTNGIDSTYVSSSYGSLQTDGIRSHTHGIDFGYLTTASGGGSQNAYNSTSPNFNNPGSGSGRGTGITTSNNNPYSDTRPGNFAVLYCIKY